MDYDRNEVSEKIHTTIANALALCSLDFNRAFIPYTFSSNNYLVTVLTHKDLEGNEHSISFMSTSLQRAKLNYLVLINKLMLFLGLSNTLDPTLLLIILR